MNSNILIGIGSLACLLACGQLAQAEQIKIPIGEQSAELNTIARPTLGMSKARVQQQFGEPLQQTAAKGKPPISSWEYAQFTVYFENDHVIHSVLKPVYHESTVTVVKETVILEEAKPKAGDEPEEDLKLNQK
ncbi:MAG TPA: hypothetical protein VN030_02210 [Cellvibrio sp.]|nr:hypothetical protein [Cellvibrio sp.]